MVKKAKDPRGVRRVARSRRPSTNDETQEPENDIEVTNHEEEQDWLEVSATRPSSELFRVITFSALLFCCASFLTKFFP